MCVVCVIPVSSLVGLHQKLPPVISAELVGVVSDTLMDTIKGQRLQGVPGCFPLCGSTNWRLCLIP